MAGAVDSSGLLGIVVAVAIAGVAGVLGGASYLYASDHAFGADVTQVSCKGPLVPDSRNSATVETRFLSIERTVTGIPDLQCSQLREGYYVEHFIRSKRTILYEGQGGDCLYDTARGVNC